MTRHSGTGPMGPWVLAPSLVAMEAEADRMAPNRSRRSDGSIGDAAHAARKSDHNPDEAGRIDYVDALDLTHDPVAGFDAHGQARSVARNISNGVETRLDYIISNRQIFSQRLGVWAWRPYTGSNGHTQHAHFSVRDSGRFDTSPWFASLLPFPPATHTPPPYRPRFLTRKVDAMLIRSEGYGLFLITPAGLIVDMSPESFGKSEATMPVVNLTPAECMKALGRS